MLRQWLLSLAALSAFGAPAFAEEANKVVVLNLEFDPGVTEDLSLQKSYFDTISAQLKTSPSTGENIEDQVQLFGCDEANDACLAKVSGALKARYVYYGRVSKGGQFSVFLFDAGAKTVIAKSSERLPVGKESEGFRKANQRVLGVPSAAAIRNGEVDASKPVPVAGERPKVGLYFLAPAGLAVAGSMMGLVAIGFQVGDPEGGLLDANDGCGTGAEPCISSGERNLIRAADIAFISAGVALAGVSALAVVKLKKAKSSGEVSAQASFTGRGAAVSVSF